MKKGKVGIVKTSGMVQNHGSKMKLREEYFICMEKRNLVKMLFLYCIWLMKLGCVLLLLVLFGSITYYSFNTNIVSIHCYSSYKCP